MSAIPVPDLAGNMRERFRDEEAKKRYNEKNVVGAGREEYLKSLPYAWHLMQSFTEIETGINRIILSCLVGPDTPKEGLPELKECFSFDARLRMVRRLCRTKDLKITPAFETVQMSGEFCQGIDENAKQYELTPLDAIQSVMKFRNTLAHEGFIFFVEEDSKGSFKHIPVIVPRNSKIPFVHLYHVCPESRGDGKEQVSFHTLVWRLASGLPVYFGSSMFEKPTAIEDPVAFLNNAYKKQTNSNDSLHSQIVTTQAK